MNSRGTNSERPSQFRLDQVYALRSIVIVKPLDARFVIPKVPRLLRIASCDIAQEPIDAHHGGVKLALRCWMTCLLFLAPVAQAAAPAGPNILFVLADQWRTQAFGFAGDRNVRTPHLDRFERQCVNFTQAVSGVPVCSPARCGADPSGGAILLRCFSPFGELTRQRGGREYRALRSAMHTFVRDLNGPWLLYNNVADPSQLKNLVGQPAHAKLQSELDALLSRKLAAQHDDFRPGPEYVRKWGYQLDANETVPYTP